MTNALALSSLALAVLSLMTTSVFALGLGRVEMAISIASIIVTVSELVHRSRSGQASPGSPTPAFEIPWATGLFGGFFGGAIAAPLIAAIYYAVLQASREPMIALGLPQPDEAQLFFEIAIAALAIGTVLGMLTLGAAAFFDHLRRMAPVLTPIFNRLTGAIVGGIAAGLICGPLGTLYFGMKPLPVLEPSAMLLGALPAAGLMAFSIITYGNDRVGRATLFNLTVSMAAVAIVAIVIAVVSTALAAEIADLIHRYIVFGSRSELLTGGLYYGAFVGAALGTVVGLALTLTSRRRD